MCPAAGKDALHEVFEHPQLFLTVFDSLRTAEQHRRSIIDRMVEAGARQHQAVEQCHGEADFGAFRFPDHPARRRTVPEDFIALAPMNGRRHDRLPIQHVANMAIRRRIEDRVQCHAIIARILIEPFGARSLARGFALTCHHHLVLGRIQWKRLMA